MPKGTESILVVDDEEFIRNMLAEMLEILGYKVHLASNGKMAIKTFKTIHKKLGCVILDVSMPYMDGKTCITALKTINLNVPVIFASGHDLVATRVELFGLGADGVIQKPYLISDLAEQIRTVISDSKTKVIKREE